MLPLLSSVGFSFFISGLGEKLLSEEKIIKGPPLTFLKSSLIGVSILITTYLPHIIAKAENYKNLVRVEQLNNPYNFMLSPFSIVSIAGIVAGIAIPRFAKLNIAQTFALTVLGIGGGLLGLRLGLYD